MLASYGHAAAVQSLLEAGASANVGRMLGPHGSFGSGSPMVEAAKHGHGATVEVLVLIPMLIHDCHTHCTSHVESRYLCCVRA